MEPGTQQTSAANAPAEANRGCAGDLPPAPAAQQVCHITLQLSAAPGANAVCCWHSQHMLEAGQQT